jgi:hypothetical protein
VAFDFARLRALVGGWLDRVRNRGYAPPQPYMERLRSRKQEVAREVGRRRAVLGAPSAQAHAVAPATTLEPTADAPSYVPPTAADREPPPLPATRETSSSETRAVEADDYTSRLLKAKRNVRYGRRDAVPPGSPRSRPELPDDLN